MRLRNSLIMISFLMGFSCVQEKGVKLLPETPEHLKFDTTFANIRFGPGPPSALLRVVGAEKQIWRRSYEEGEGLKGVPESLISGSGNHQRKTECGGVREDPHLGNSGMSVDRAKNGDRSIRATLPRIENGPCEEWTSRLYETQGGRFRLPVLVSFWLFSENEWDKMAPGRFSPLTTKGKEPKDGGQILTTHILSDGSMDIGHAALFNHDRSVRVPVREWVHHALYIENRDQETYAVLWSDGEKVVEGICNGYWDESELRDWHMGLYANYQEVREDLFLYNDDVEIREVGGIVEALLVIGIAVGEETEREVVVEWDANSEADLAGYKVYYGSGSRSYDKVIDVGDVLLYKVNLPESKYYFAVTAYDLAGNESPFSDEVIADMDEAPAKPTNVRIIN